MDIEKVEKKLGYSFSEKARLIRALTRKDAVEKNQVDHDFGHQEIYATLGDAILKAILAHQLIKSGKTTAKTITDDRIAIENRATLASISQELMIGDFMLTSNGEEKENANRMPTPLAETLEAVIGAIFLDAGYDKTMKVITSWKGFERYLL